VLVPRMVRVHVSVPEIVRVCAKCVRQL
jgi:hypothetical protein